MTRNSSPERSTESRNPRSIGIDGLGTLGILTIINDEDAGVAGAVRDALPEIARAVDLAVEALRRGGRIVYVGAGTSGRLALVDAVECPPTFNSPPEWFTVLFAGGPRALSDAAEGAEDQPDRAAADLARVGLAREDLVVAIAASGRTPYTLAATRHAIARGTPVIGIVCAPNTPIAAAATLAVEVDVGPEVIAGSTRMKAGTAQKMILNMFSTATMVRMDMTYDNWMINVRMTNQKLRARGLRLLEEILGVDASTAEDLAIRSGGDLKIAVVMGRLGCSKREADERLRAAAGRLRAALGECSR